MCRLTSQMNPNSAQINVAMNSAIGSATHGGRLNLRPAHSGGLLSHVMRRCRCRYPSHSSPAVTTSATTDIAITWSSAAPPPSLPWASTEKVSELVEYPVEYVIAI